MESTVKNKKKNFPVASVLTIGGFFFLIFLVRTYWVQSYHISTHSMEDALHKGDFVLVNKLHSRNNPRRGRVVLFESPLLRDQKDKPLFVSRVIGMPGDTIRVTDNGYFVNGKAVPHSPQTIYNYRVTSFARDNFIRAFRKLSLPRRNWKENGDSIFLSMTQFENFQIREELSPDEISQVEQLPIGSYTLIVPRKDCSYQLDPISVQVVKDAIARETGQDIKIENGKLFIDGKEISFFNFDRNYYWVLSDNTADAIDSRYLGFVPEDYIIGNIWFCWYSNSGERIFKKID